MKNQITDEQLEILEGFVGYGNPDAKIIFIGIEERGGGYWNLEKRFNTPNYKFIDCKRFHLDNEISIKHHSDKSYKDLKLQGVWKFMCYFMLRLNGHTKDEIDAKNKILMREYQSEYLGTTNSKGETLLTELYPIPCEKENIWGIPKEKYYDIIPQYKSKKDYRRNVLPKRIKIFRDLINSPKFQASNIICYGNGNWKDFENFFAEFNVEFKDIETSKRSKMGQMKNGVNVFLVPFFGNGNIDYQTLDDIVNKIKSSR